MYQIPTTKAIPDNIPARQSVNGNCGIRMAAGGKGRGSVVMRFLIVRKLKNIFLNFVSSAEGPITKRYWRPITFCKTARA
jgi:hypothetical protein